MSSNERRRREGRSDEASSKRIKNQRFRAENVKLQADLRLEQSVFSSDQFKTLNYFIGAACKYDHEQLTRERTRQRKVNET